MAALELVGLVALCIGVRWWRVTRYVAAVKRHLGDTATGAVSDDEIARMYDAGLIPLRAAYILATREGP